MKPFDEDWKKLVAAARKAPEDGDLSAPYGFSTRVASLAFETRKESSLFGVFALRAAGISLALALVAVAATYQAAQGAFESDAPASNSSTPAPGGAADDPVSEVVNMGS